MKVLLLTKVGSFRLVSGMGARLLGERARSKQVVVVMVAVVVVAVVVVVLVVLAVVVFVSGMKSGPGLGIVRFAYGGKACRGITAYFVGVVVAAISASLLVPLPTEVPATAPQPSPPVARAPPPPTCACDSMYCLMSTIRISGRRGFASASSAAAAARAARAV